MLSTMNDHNREHRSAKYLPHLSCQSEYDDWKFKAEAKLVTMGLYHCIEEGGAPSPIRVIDRERGDALRAERVALIESQKADQTKNNTSQSAGGDGGGGGGGGKGKESAGSSSAPSSSSASGGSPSGKVPAELLQPITDPKRFETEIEYNIRIAPWHAHNRSLWSEIATVLHDEALTVGKRTTKGDGVGIWNELQTRYESTSISTQLALLVQLMDMKIHGGNVQTHVTTFRDIVAKLEGKNCGFNEVMTCVLFLKSLNAQFKQFVTYQMQKSTMDIFKLYKDAIEFAEVNLGQDESKQPHAMWGSENDKPRACKFGPGCHHLAQGTCNFWHPDSHIQDHNHGQGRGGGGRGGGGSGRGNARGRGNRRGGGRNGGKGGGRGGGQDEIRDGWTCCKCNTRNYRWRNICYKCKFNRKQGGGAGTKRKFEQKEQVAYLAELEAKCTRQEGQMAVVKARVEASGASIECGYLAVEYASVTEEETGNAQITEPSVEVNSANIQDRIDALSEETNSWSSMSTSQRSESFTRVAEHVAALAGTMRAVTTVWKADSGASSHFANKRVKLAHVRSDDTKVMIADGTSVEVDGVGQYVGTSGDHRLQMNVKQSEAFSHNLFSIRQAVKDGYRAVFDAEESYLQHRQTGDRIPMRSTASGWDVIFH